jgi:hypothetical protein
LDTGRTGTPQFDDRRTVVLQVRWFASARQAGHPFSVSSDLTESADRIEKAEYADNIDSARLQGLS